MTLTSMSMAGRTRPEAGVLSGLPLALICTAAVAAVAALDLALDPGRLLFSLGDTDDATRLVEVREFLAGSSWFDMTLPRIGAPDALVSHWSRLVDLGIATLIRLFGLGLGQPQAELAARFLWPLLLMLPLVLLIAGEAERRAGRVAALIAIGLLLTSVTGTAEFKPGRIDHHSAMNLAAVAGGLLLARSLSAPAWASGAGLALGLGLAVGYEALGLTIAALGLATAWTLLTGRHRLPVVRATTAFAATLTLSWLATTAPAQWLHSHCDALSLNLVALAICGACGLAVASRDDSDWPLDVRLGVSAAFCAAGLVLYIFAEPACLSGPFGQQDPAIGALWLDHVNETKSLLELARKLPSVAIAFMLTTLAGLCAACWLATLERRQQVTAGGETLALAILAVAGVLACWQIKLLPYATLLAIPPLAVALARIDRLEGVSATTLRGVGTVLSSQLGLMILITPIAAKWAPDDPELTRRIEIASRCTASSTASRLATLPPGLVFSDRDLGPYIAALTAHRVVAAPYHRLDKAIIDTDRLFFGPTDAAHLRLAGLGVDYVAICPGFTNGYGRQLRPDSLYTLFRDGRPPDWLQHVALPQGATLEVWRLAR